MASWTDKKPEFNPYIAQKPVEAMVKVGMQKQAQYNQGYEKIQQSIDNIAGLDVMRDKDKAHLQGKLTQLGSRLQTVAAGDFSNFQLTTSVAGMAKNLINDPGIQGSVASTQKFKKQQAIVDKARKDGTLTPDNEYHYQKQVQSYLDDEEIGANFSGEYVEYFDVYDHAKEVFNELKPDDMTFDQVYQLDANGQPMMDADGTLIYSPTMTRRIEEGLDPKKVQAAMTQIMSDPRVSRQLNITGEYNYRGVTVPEMHARLDNQKDKSVAAIDQSLAKAQIDLAHGKDVQGEIDYLTQQKADVNQQYQSMAIMAQNNPDAIRGMMYKNEVQSRYTTMFGQRSVKQTVHANPGANFVFKQQQEATDNRQWAADYNFKVKKQTADMNFKVAGAVQDQLNFDAKMGLEMLKLEQASKNKGNTNKDGTPVLGAGPEGTGGFTPDVEPSSLDVINLQQQEYDQASESFNNASAEVVYDNVLAQDPRSQAMMTEAIGNGLTREEAIDVIIRKNAEEAIPDSEVPDGQTKVAVYRSKILGESVSNWNGLTQDEKDALPDKQHMYENYYDTQKKFNTQQNLKNRIEDQLVEELGEVAEDASFDNVKPMTVVFEDVEYTLDKKDQVDLAIYRRGSRHGFLSILENDVAQKAAKQAEKRLRLRNLGPMITAIERDMASKDARQAPITGVARYVTDTNPLFDIGRGIRYESERFGDERDWSSVNEIEDKISNKESLERIERRAEVTNNLSRKDPNQQTPILSGNLEQDRNTLNRLGTYAGTYASNEQNASPDFEGFAENLNKVIKENYKMTAGVSTDVNGQPITEIRMYGDDSKLLGSMQITDQEANQIGIQADALYETPEVKDIRTNLMLNNGQTCKGDINSTATYRNGDVYYHQKDLPQMRGAEVDNISVNFKERNGNFFPVLYIKKGDTEIIKTLPGGENLSQQTLKVKGRMTPTFINKVITEENAKRNAKQREESFK